MKKKREGLDRLSPPTSHAIRKNRGKKIDEKEYATGKKEKLWKLLVTYSTKALGRVNCLGKTPSWEGCPMGERKGLDIKKEGRPDS